MHEIANLVQLCAEACLIDRCLGREIEIGRKSRRREICLSETVSSLENETVFERTYRVEAGQKPAEDIVAFNVRDVNLELCGFSLNFVLRDHLTRSRSSLILILTNTLWPNKCSFHKSRNDSGIHN